MQLDEEGTAEGAPQTAAAEDGVVRALSLANALLNRPGGLTREQIFDKIELYRARRDERDRLVGSQRQRADDALEKLFGHDKEHLRSCGIKLLEPTAEDDYRYRISRTQYGLPDLSLTSQERSALYRAQLQFARNTIAGLQHAVWAIDPEYDDAAGSPAAPRVVQSSIGSDTEVAHLLDISRIGLRAAITFRYTGRGRRQAETRRVVPLGMGVRGHWYLLAHDLDRDAQRTFRLDRVSGTISTLPAASLSEPESVTLKQITRGGRYAALDVAAEVDRNVAGFTEHDAVEGALRVHQDEAPGTLPKLTRGTSRRRRDDASTKTERVINMIALLLTRGGIRPSELLEKYSLTPDQLLRDLLSISLVTTDQYPDTLDVTPFPPLNDEQFITEYLTADQPIELRASGGAMDRPVSLTKPGAMSLLIALKSLIELCPPGDEHIAAAAESLQRKVMAIVPEPIAHAAESMSLAPQAAHRAVLRAAQQASSAGHAVELAYTDISGRSSTRVVEPVQVVHDGPHTYMRAWCRRAQGERFFRLDRIADLKPLPHDPQGERSAALSLSDSSGPQVPVTADSVSVVLRFSPSAAGQAFLYHPVKQHTEKVTGARTILTSFVTKEAVIGTCLRAGGDVEVIRPVELREEVAERALELLGQQQK
ncbi:WYL domain-containing protein [Nesterenkonia natronophila]|uniref:WYL domain-containing protein n=2 Tax=Nesterenkonia natronophila TaxID=2174932 RepID=A0A3A4EZK9_9MICC|nr:WYL domain-containing protein [Nesterenkonia natronophila]